MADRFRIGGGSGYGSDVLTGFFSLVRDVPA